MSDTTHLVRDTSFRYPFAFNLPPETYDGGWTVIKNDGSITSYQRSKSAHKAEPPEDISTLTLSESGINLMINFPQMENRMQYLEIFEGQVQSVDGTVPPQDLKGHLIGVRLIAPDTCFRRINLANDGRGLHIVLQTAKGRTSEIELYLNGSGLAQYYLSPGKQAEPSPAAAGMR